MATIYAVSELAGVSLATVSRVINGNQKVSAKTRKKVEQAIKTLDYRPNSAAKSLATNRTDSVGLLVSELYGPFYGALMSEIELALRDAGKHVIVTAGHEEEDSEKAGLEFLTDRNCDALILHAEAIDDATLVALTKSETPVILLNREIGAVSNHCIYLDNFLGGKVAMNCLLDHGHRQIAYISGPLWKLDARQRQDGAKAVLQEKGLHLLPELVQVGDYHEDTGYACMKLILDTGKPLTAVACANDLMASGAMRAIREAGLSTPDDISVIGFDDIEFARFLYPRLTTVKYPINAMGKMAANIILHRRYGLPIHETHFKFQPELVVRDSVKYL